jgi:transposase InsO family protein
LAWPSCALTAEEYSRLLEAHEIRPSMSRVGSPYDNAKAESFMKTLKLEEVDGRAYRDVEDARTHMSAFIDDVYNRQRLHLALGYLSAAEFEATVRPVVVSEPAGVLAVIGDFH